MSGAEAKAAKAAALAPRKWIKGPRCAQDYADVVIRCLDTAAVHIFDAGNTLIKAKENLDHGEWLRMFKCHDNPVAHPIPFGVRTAQMLMKIAEHPVLSNTNHGSRLPTSWRTLYELTKLPEPVLSKALTDGRVHPGMERRDVGALRDVRETPEEKSPTTTRTVEDAIRRIRDVLNAELRAFSSPEDRREIGLFLRQQVHFLVRLEERVADPAAQVVAEPAADRVAEPAGEPVAEDAETVAPYCCATCGRGLAEDELAEIRECSRDNCGERFDAAAEGDRNCPVCRRAFTRLITKEGCPDCMGEDGDVVEAGLAAMPEGGA